MKNVFEIKITRNGSAWEKALDKAYHKKNKEVKIEGFRKGMVPKDIFIKKLGIETLYMDAVDFIADDCYKEALEKENLVPVVDSSYDIENISEKEVTLVFKVITKPEVTLGEYKKLNVKKEKAKVTKEEIKEEIERLKWQLAEIAPKEVGKLEEGNIAVISFEGFVDGKKLDGGSGENYSLEIGSHKFIPGFEEGLIGMEVGEERELNLKFPDDYIDKLKGKEVKFNVTLEEIKERIIPEVNEDFYKDLGYENIKTEEEFEEEVKNVILERKNSDIEDKFIDDCLKSATDNLKVEINEEIIDDEVHRMIHQFEDQVRMQGIKIEDYMRITGLTHEKLHENMRPEAINRIKSRYLLEAIAEKEKIDFTKEEVEAKTKEMADNYGITAEELIKAYGGEDVIKYDMKMHKALEIIKENN